MQDLTFKKPIIYSAFQKSSLYLFDPLVVLTKLKEFSTPKRTLAIQDKSASELEFEVDFKRAITPMSLQIYKAYNSYIEKKLFQSIEYKMTLTPTTSKLIEKHEKANKLNLLTGKLAIEELFKKQQAELNIVCPNGERVVQQYRTICVGYARLQIAARDLEEKRTIEAIQSGKGESLRKKREYREGVDMCKQERITKKEAKAAGKEAREAARVARMADLIANPLRKRARRRASTYVDLVDMLQIDLSLYILYIQEQCRTGDSLALRKVRRYSRNG